MIKFVSGNILESNTEALVNTVNCVGVMGKGVALLFKKKFPDNYTAYKRECNKQAVKPGKMFVFETNLLFNPRYIINFPTKRHWRNDSLVEDIKLGLDAMVYVIEQKKISSVAIPALGCGNGGLDWEEVRPLILNVFSKLKDVEISLYSPQGYQDYIAPERVSQGK